MSVRSAVARDWHSFGRMRRAILAVCGLVAGAVVGVAACVGEPPPSPAEATAATVGSSPTTPPQADLNYTPSEPDVERVGEAEQPMGPLFLTGLAATCALAVYVVVHYGCEESYFEDYCPRGQHQIITDVWDKKKLVFISCDAVKVLVCGTAEITAGAAMARFCGHVTL